MATIKVEIELDVYEENFESESIYVQSRSLGSLRKTVREELNLFFNKCMRTNYYSDLKGHLNDHKIVIKRGKK